MTNNTRETIHHELLELPESEDALPLEIVNPEAVSAFTDASAKMLEAIAHDQPVTKRALLAFEEAIGALRFDVGNGTLVSVGDIPGALKEQAALWKRIEQMSVEELENMYDLEYCKTVLALTMIPARVARKLSEVNRRLVFDKVTFLSDQAAQEFGEHQNELFLYKVPLMGDEAIEHLSRHSGPLKLGLKHVSEIQARLLSQQDGDLTLFGSPEISDGALSELVAHKGSLALTLEPLSVVRAQILARYQGRRLEVMNNDMPDEVIEALSTYGGRGRELVLSGIRQLSVRGAKALSNHRGNLCLPNLEHDRASEEVMQLLARHWGNLTVIDETLQRKIDERKK